MHLQTLKLRWRGAFRQWVPYKWVGEREGVRGRERVRRGRHGETFTILKHQGILILMLLRSAKREYICKAYLVCVCPELLARPVRSMAAAFLHGPSRRVHGWLLARGSFVSWARGVTWHSEGQLSKSLHKAYKD